MNKTKWIITGILFFLLPFIMSASDKSEAEALMKTSIANSELTNIAVGNFGNDKIKADFEKGMTLIKSGKVKFLQAKYLDAKKLFDDYLTLEDGIYKDLSPIYTKRLQEIIDRAAEDLVDYAEDVNIVKCFTDSNTKLEAAKAAITKAQYKAVINSCRVAKKLVISAYATAKVAVPEEFAKDLKDADNKLF